MQNLALLELASAAARHAASRHSVIAENVANADTPGYRARDVEAFSALVNDGFTPRATRPGHAGWEAAAGRGVPMREPRTVELAAPPSPNGNTVSLEDQSLRAVETEGRHRLATTVYSKALDILRIGLGPNR